MSRDSMVSSLPSNGWSCATLEEGIQIAAQQAGLTLKTQDYTKVSEVLMHTLQAYAAQPAPGNAAPLQRVKVEPVAPERPLATPSPPKVSGMAPPVADPEGDTIPGDVPSPVLSNKGSRPETPASFQKVATLVHGLPPATYDLEATKQNQELMAEKLKNEQLQAQIQRLELASQTAQKEYELAKCQKESETSKLETLLTKTLSRVDDLEKMMKDSPAEPPKPAEKPNAQPTETKQSQKARAAEPQSGSEKSDSDGESDSEEEKSMVTPDGRVVPISPDALRMRCRRLCERKPSGRLQVEASMSDAYKAGGEQREALEMTLLESLATHGHGRSSYKKIKADFVKRFRLVKECLESRESEVHGKWMTEEAMKKRQVFTDGHQEYYFLLQEVS